MTSAAYQTHFIPFGPMRPDAPEFDSRSMERVQNYLSVFSGYRPVVKTIEISRSNAQDEVTGSHTHRSTERTGFEVLQPAATSLVEPDIVIVPSLSLVHEVLRGFAANDGAFIQMLRQDAALDTQTDGTFQLPSRDWSNTGTDLVTIRMRYRIPSGATGAYTLTLSYGTLVASVHTEVGTIIVTGTLQVDGDDLWVTVTTTEPLSSYPASPETLVHSYEIHEIMADQTAIQYWGDETLAASMFTIIGGDPTIHQALDKSGGTDDARFITIALGEDAEDHVHVGLPSINRVDRDSIDLNVRFEVTDTTMELLVELREDVDSVDTLRESFEVTPGAADTPIDAVISVAVATYDAIVDLAKISYRVGFRGGSVGGSAQSWLVTKIDDVAPAGSWTQYGAGTDIGVLADADDATGHESSTSTEVATNRFSSIDVDIPILNPPVFSATALEIKARVGAVGGRCVYRVALREHGGSEIFESSTFQVEAGLFTDFSRFLEQNEFNLISQFDHLYLRIWRRSDQGADPTATSRFAEASLETDNGDSEGRVYEANFEQPGDAEIDVSWVNLDAELEGTFLPGDNIKFYFGTRDRVFELVSPYDTFDDISKGSVDYTDIGSVSWHFTTWGDKLICTNKINPHQVKEIGDTELRDLFGFDPTGVAIPNYASDGFEKPRGRFNATINAFLCIANVDDVSFVDGRPYTLWCSAIGDPTRMHPGDFNTQSTIFQLVSTPGEITGLVGGEYGILLKEDSIYRVDYTGFPEIFTFTQFQIEQGCPYPRSIVKAGGDVYFWGVHGIFRVVNGQRVEDISTGHVDKMLFDSLFELFSIESDVSEDLRRNDAKVFGAYDANSENIYWAYKTSAGSDYVNTVILCYNTHRKRFTLLTGGDSLLGDYDASALVSLGNHQVASDATARGVFLIERESAGNNVLRSFRDVNTEDGLMLTNTIGSNDFPGAGGSKETDIHMIRPVYKVEDGRVRPKITVDIDAGQFPDLQSGFVEERTVSTGPPDENDDGWLSLGQPLSGEFYKFEARTDETDEPALKEFLGLQVLYKVKVSSR